MKNGRSLTQEKNVVPGSGGKRVSIRPPSGGKNGLNTSG